MTHTLKSVGALLTITLGMSAPLPAAKDTNAGPAIESEAVEALKSMGAYLRSLKAFQINSKSTSEVVLKDGQKVQYGRRTTLLAKTPDRLRGETEGDRGTMLYFYDGKKFTLFAKDDGYYSTVSAPPTLREFVDFVDDKYKVEIPLVDLFRWGAPGVDSPVLTGAIDLGPSEIEGITCEHYAFRQEGLDWQVWIQRGDFPLPRKFVLTTTTDEARPQHSSVLEWNLAPSYNETAFTFTPPPGTHEIVFAGQAVRGKK